MRIRRKGVSLVEVLIVVGIVALLAAILFPILARAKREGYKTTCRSNLRQSAAAWNLYLEDQGGMPLVGVHQLHAYSRDYEVFRCPEDRLGASGLPLGWTGGRPTSYATAFRDDRSRWTRLAQADANHGVFYCALHGEWRFPPSGMRIDYVGATSSKRGPILRARRDGSVQSVRVSHRYVEEKPGVGYGNRCEWEILTDVALPRGACLVGGVTPPLDLGDGKVTGD